MTGHRTLRRPPRFWGAFGAYSLTLLVACSEDPPARPPILPESVQVEITPERITLARGATFPFRAVVRHAADTTVVWSVPGGEAFGSITPQGVYRAPDPLPSTRIASIVARSAADASSADTAFVDLVEPVTVVIDPALAIVSEGGESAFRARVANAADSTVVWTVLEGAGFGSVSGSGLYRAPDVLPNPPRAHVMVESVADSAASDTAEIELVPGPPEGEGEALFRSIDAGWVAGQLSEQLTATVSYALLDAARQTGGDTVLTGTLTVREGYDTAYDPQPTDRFRIVSPYSPTWEFWVRLFRWDGYTWGGWGNEYIDGYSFHGVLACAIRIEGREITLVNDSRHWSPWEGASSPQTVVEGTEFSRSLTGNVTLTSGETWFVDLSHRGTVDYSTQPSFYVVEQISGRIDAEDWDLALEQALERGWSCDLHYETNQGYQSWLVGGSNRLTWQGTSYVWEHLQIRGALHNHPTCNYIGRVIYPDYWNAEGALRRNSLQYGRVRFEGPVVFDQYGPDAVLEYSHGHRIVLKRPGTAAREPRVVPSPFLNPDLQQ